MLVANMKTKTVIAIGENFFVYIFFAETENVLAKLIFFIANKCLS